MKQDLSKLFHHIHASLGSKYILLVAAVLFVTMGLTAAFNYHSQKELFEEQLASKGRVLATFIAEISPESILSYDLISLNEYTENVSHQQDIVYAAVLAPDGKAMTSYLNEDNLYISDIIKRIQKHSAEKIIGLLKTNQHILHTQQLIKFNNQILGSVVIGLDTAPLLNQTRLELAKQLTINFSIILFLSICIYTVFRVNVLRPINKLMSGAARVAKGNLNEEIEIASNDEFGGLQQMFNNMMHKLKNSNTEKDQALLQLQELNVSLESHVDDRTQALEAANAELQFLAMHDPLTGLANRALIADRLNQAIQVGKREHKPVMVVMMDLDRFKEVNDTLGHDTGDALLKHVAERLLHTMRESDAVGRLGGDEFTIIIPGADKEHAPLVANKVLGAFEHPFVLDGNSFIISSSLGITLFPEHGKDSSTLLQRADVAMYVSKRNQAGYLVYDPESDQSSMDHLSMAGELRDAIANGQLCLHYQPKLDLTSGQVIGVEALARWFHPDRGFIAPEIFIPIMEQTGLIKQYARWALDVALAQWSRWRKEGIVLTMAVNLSMYNLRDVDLPIHLSTLMKKYGVSRGSLILEITESTIMSDPHHVMMLLTHLEAMGVDLSIDDFGTGYSSLSYMKRLPVHEIKIDRSFVDEMTHDSDDEVIVRSVIDLAHNLGMKVIAEGVESLEAIKLLQQLDCEYAQGHFISVPLPAEEINTFLKQSKWSMKKYGRRTVK